MSSMVLNLLLDSTYLLPSFGIKVEGLSDEQILRLRVAKIKGKVKFYCLPLVWVEIISKVHREARRRRVDVENIIAVATKSLLDSGFYEWITPGSKAIELAFKLRVLGHRDNIDNLLYATSLEKNMVFLTMDKEFREFLSNHGYKTENLMDHNQLLSMLG